jgi:hypothetical protein
MYCFYTVEIRKQPHHGQRANLGKEGTTLRPGCIKRCQVRCVNILVMSSDQIGEYLTFYLNQPIKWEDFRLAAFVS